jgi:hypothetical protein
MLCSPDEDAQQFLCGNLVLAPDLLKDALWPRSLAA